MKLTMVRHTAVDVEPGVCYGQTDVGLRDTFPAEAAVTAEKLAGKEFDRVLTSPLSRCTRLAESCGYADAERDPRLMEMNFGEWEMRRYDEITDPRLQEWYDDYLHVRATGGESFADQRRRVSAVIEELKDSGAENVLIFAHGGVIMQGMLLSGYADESNLFSLQPAYGEVIELEF